MSTLNNQQLQKINAVTLKQWLEQKEVLLIDVREPSEFAVEHIPGAKLMPFSQFDSSMIPQNTAQKIVLQCQSGKRSAQAAQKMSERGFRDVFDLQGGLSAWKAAGYPTQVNQKAAMSMFRQVQIVAGSLVFLGTLLGVLISPWFLMLSGFVGLGLVFSGITNTCAMALLLAQLPYNQRAVNVGELVG